MGHCLGSLEKASSYHLSPYHQNFLLHLDSRTVDQQIEGGAMRSITAIVFIVGFLLISVPAFVYAEADARDYIAAPEGTKLMAVYYNHQAGNELYADGDKVSDDFNFSANIGILRPVIYTKIGPILVDPQILIPFGDLSLDGDAVGGTEIASTGLGDPVLASSFWLINRPEQKWWLGFSPYFYIPIGDYDNDKILNLGDNRWKFREEIGTVKGLGDKAYLGLIGAVEFYTDNNDFGASEVTQEQDPAFFAEVHLSYDITNTFYVAADYFYKYGGETTIDSVDQDNEASDHAMRLGFGFSLNNNTKLLLKYRSDLQVENGPKTQSFETRFMYVF